MSPLRRTLLAPFALGLALAWPVVHDAWGQLRAIPPEAKRGQIRHLQDMYVAIDGRRVRLAPGAQIRDAQNRVVLPAALPPGTRIAFTLDAEGLVNRAWILTREEAARPAAKR